MFKRYQLTVADGTTGYINVPPSNAFWADQVENSKMRIGTNAKTDRGLTQWKDRMGCRMEDTFTRFMVENNTGAEKTVIVYIGSGWMWLGAP